jgi:hypothetical protein
LGATEPADGHPTFAPAETSTDTRGDPLAFMTTIDQEPDFGVHVRSAESCPVVEAAPNVWEAGRPGFAVPRWVT